jgi:hypothetical protein
LQQHGASVGRIPPGGGARGMPGIAEEEEDDDEVPDLVEGFDEGEDEG